MGRKQQSKRIPPQNTAAVSPAVPEQNSHMATWIIRLPRVVRIILIVLPALAATVIFVPVIDSIYLRYFYSDESRMLPSIITAGIALTVYLIGWVLVVGTTGETPEERRSVSLYMSFSLLLMAIASVYLAVLMLGGLE